MTTPAASALAPKLPPVIPFFAISVCGHVVVVGVILALNWLLAPKLIDLDQKPITASLVRLGHKRDEKLLPRKDEEAPPPPEKTVAIAPKPDVVPQPKTPAKTATEEKKSLFDAMKKISKAAKPEELEGDENGDPNGLDAKQEGERYYGLISTAVRRYYDVSNTIAEDERRTLAAVVSFKVSPKGEVSDLQLAKPSGNSLFDDAVISAVKKAAPFPPPPDHLRDPLRKDGIQLRFTP